MRSKFRLKTAVTALLCAATMAAGGATAVAAPAEPGDGRLSTSTSGAPRIVDDLGRTVLLRGINVNGLGEYYQEFPDLDPTMPLTEADFAGIATQGFNVVRLIMSWSLIEPQRGVFDHSYLDKIAQATEWAKAHDIGVILDMHQDAWGPAVATPDGVSCPAPLATSVGWDGAPAWATATMGGLATCRLADSREVSVVVQQSFENFYNDVNGIQGEFIKSWEFVVRRFAADPTVVGYDLLNEPSPGLSVGINDYLRLGAMYDRLIPAIRAAEASVPGGFSHTAYFEPSVASSLLPTPGPATGSAGSAGSSGEPRFTSDPNLVYAPHIYNESLPLAVGSIESGFAAAAKAAEGYGGTPFFSGEWGFFGDDASNPEKVARYAAQEDAYLVGGTWWQWKQACGDPHNVQHRENRPDWCQAGEFGEFESFPADSPIRAILSRAYPRAVPGELTAIRADVPSGALEVEGVADRAGVSADLWVPARCAVPEVSGTNIGAGTVRSVAGGSRVSVPVSGAGEYTITVAC
ncbi:endoglycosylceramidase [Rhodococcus tukisamuensis]|uniref:Endoglycosylceramidase n=1 Tax=Rhodococcus tukisamuensis TaxID=168276 RepID=A0A1G6XTB1_9NOCA|nr:endoglycosylceramidase [Rhodococcus tukisamuensis]